MLVGDMTGTGERPEGEKAPPSWGNMSEHHWSRSREGMNAEALEHYRRRSQAPGVEAGGSERNHYCLECNGVIPLVYDSREAAGKAAERCPHCGVELEGRVRAMFNWVETDQVPDSDLKAILLLFLAGLVVVALVAATAWWVFR
jgi:hypothetical protein